jgi:release factor glutamine methyltransferase
MINEFIKKISDHTIRPLAKLYLSKTRKYKYDSIEVEIPSGVFHPGIFFSTKILLKYLLQFDLQNKSLLEVGAGSGLISISAAGKGANVTATDISLSAIGAIENNMRTNHVELKIIYSDLWKNLPQQIFDFIVVNPPFYFRDPKDESAFSWYAGANGEYFERFFSGVKNYMNDQTKTLMILSNECDVDAIAKYAKAGNCKMNEVFKKNILWEQQKIFQITRK